MSKAKALLIEGIKQADAESSAMKEALAEIEQLESDKADAVAARVELDNQNCVLRGQIDSLQSENEIRMDALRAIWPFIKEDFPNGLGNNHRTCCSFEYIEAARKIEQALPAPVSPSAPKETQAQVKEKAPAANACPGRSRGERGQ